jgi:hypothetical protein
MGIRTEKRSILDVEIVVAGIDLMRFPHLLLKEYNLA